MLQNFYTAHYYCYKLLEHIANYTYIFMKL